MSIMRKAMPSTRAGNREFGLRKLHLTSSLLAKAAPKRSPRVPSPSQSAPAVRFKQKYDMEESLPPFVLLKSAKMSGALSTEPENALEFLRQYQQIPKKSSGGWEQKLCAEHDITPITMVLLASILRRSTTKAQKYLAKKLMLSASELGEKQATFELISSALRTGALSEYQTPMYRLGLLAKNNDPQATTLLGRVLMSQNKDQEALVWFRKATRPPTGSLEFDGSGDALVYEGRLLSKKGDRVGAEEAFQKAALELDEPSAYFYLSQLQEPGSSEQSVYLLKAASSGVSEASHNLGVIELAKIEEKRVKDNGKVDYKMAIEWFTVAAHDGFGLSMLNLAMICKILGDEKTGLAWLERAEGLAEVADQAKEARASW